MYNAGERGGTESESQQHINCTFSCQKAGDLKRPYFDIYNLKKVTCSHNSGSGAFKNDADLRERTGGSF